MSYGTAEGALPILAMAAMDCVDRFAIRPTLQLEAELSVGRIAGNHGAPALADAGQPGESPGAQQPTYDSTRPGLE